MSNKLLPEFQAIVNDIIDNFVYTSPEAHVEETARRCQALALRVPEMSDAEIEAAWNVCEANTAFTKWDKVRAVLVYYESKRFAPVKRVVSCRLWTDASGEIHCCTEHSYNLNAPNPYNCANFKWLGDIFEREV